MELEGKFVVPESVTIINTYAFAYCYRLESVILPSKLEIIGEGAFKWFSSLKEITIPNRVTYIGKDAFYETIFPITTGLIKGAYPKNLSNPFEPGLDAIAYDEIDSMTEDGFVYSRRKDVLYYVPLSVSSTFEVPEGVTEITERAFSKCKNLESVILPEDLTTIGDRVWAECENLENVELPASLTTLGEGVWSECNAIKSVTCMGTEPVSANQDLFTNTVYDEATLYVPKGCVDAYVKVVPWRYFTNIVENESTGVENVTADNITEAQNLPCEVYTLQGVKVAGTVTNLPAGLYIVRQGKVVKKIAVK